MIRTLSIIALAAGLSMATLGCEEETGEHLEAAGESAAGNVAGEMYEAEAEMEAAGAEMEADLEAAGNEVEAEIDEAAMEAEMAEDELEADIAQAAQEEAND